MHLFHHIFFGRFRPKTYGRQFFLANNFFLGPVLSYFAEFLASWQQCWPDLDSNGMLLYQRKIIRDLIIQCNFEKASFKPHISHLAKVNITDPDPNHLEKLDPDFRLLNAELALTGAPIVSPFELVLPHIWIQIQEPIEWGSYA
jgi:hypothetical protein